MCMRSKSGCGLMQNKDIKQPCLSVEYCEGMLWFDVE